MRVRTRRWLLASGIGILSWVIAGVFVRVMLDWSDSQPYVAEVTEPRYIVTAVGAILIALAGSVAAVLFGRRRRH